MKKKTGSVVLLLSLGMLCLAPVGLAEVFHCAFIQEKYRTGKSNEASCAMMPERVFANKDFTPRRGDHCKVTSVYDYEDLQDVVVDLTEERVS